MQLQLHRMAPIMLGTVVLLLSALELVAAQSSCRGRCGSEYYRGDMCQCDYSCLSYDECCKDFESQCTTKSSCKGRCGESFRRGRLCSCDSNCLMYKQCCPDYETHCDAEEPTMTLDALDQQSFTLSEGNNQDDLKALEPPTSYDEFLETGVEILEASPIPDSSSGPEPPIVTPTQPTQGTQTVNFTTATVTVVSEAETTSLMEGSNSTVEPTNGDAPTNSTEATAQETTEETISNSIQTTSEPEASAATVLESETVGLAEVTSSPSAEPEITSAPVSTQTSITEHTQATSVPPSPPTDLTATAEGNTTTTSPPSSPITLDPPSTTASSSDPDAETTVTSLISATAREDATDNSTQEEPLPASTEPTKPQGTGPTAKPQDQYTTEKPPPSKPESKPQDPQPNNDDQQGYQADDSNDTDLCSGRPVSGVTTLRNGTTVVFRGHYFWFLDRNRVPGPARGITQVWGVPSPIDTVFTRCNCQGKTYIFKGGRYWRFENDALDAGYPRAVHTGFDGLQGHITAALSVPQHNQRTESVYFFKRGGFVQKYSYQFGTSPSCGQKTQYIVYKASRRVARQAVSVLGRAINIRTSWRGFPTTVTAAVSIPSQTQPEGYKYYVFSRSKSYSVRMDGGRPTAAPSASPAPQNDVFKCPKKV